MTLQRWIDTAVMLSRQDRPGVITEAMLLMPRVLYKLTDKFAADEATRHLVTIRESLVSVNGVLTPGSGIMLKYLRYATFENTADAAMSKKMRWVEEWDEFTRPLDASLGYFIGINTGGIARVVFTEPGTPYSSIAGPSISVDLITVHTPAIPALPAALLLTPPEFENEAVSMLAQALVDPTVLLVRPVEVAV